MKKERKLDEITKAKLVYSGELIAFAILFLVLGILKINNIMNLSRKEGATWYTYFFVILTLLGGTWFVVDFIWTLSSPKRKKKSSLVDKIILLPSSIGTFIFDIYALVVGIETIRQPIESINNNLLNYYTSFLFFYFSFIYVFQAIYHYKYPIPLLLEEIEKEKKEKEENNQIEEKDNKEN